MHICLGIVLVAVGISAFALLVMERLVMVLPSPTPSQPPVLNYHWPERILEELRSENEMLAFEEAVDDYIRKLNEGVQELTMDKETLAKEVATLKSRCEEGEEKIRKLTMDKETLSKEVHRMEMWKDANAQLKQFRAELKHGLLKEDIKDVVRAEMLVILKG
jgi:septal ring factor EnvC (AmiA/AmiB activator)